MLWRSTLPGQTALYPSATAALSIRRGIAIRGGGSDGAGRVGRVCCLFEQRPAQCTGKFTAVRDPAGVRAGVVDRAGSCLEGRVGLRS